MLSLGLGFYPALFFMNFSANIIENWLLSGKAVLKNLSCGNAGLVQIPVPEGKTYIITKIEILPFTNIITDENDYADEKTLSIVINQDLVNINERTQFQLLFYNERINNTWNIRNKFTLNTYEGNGNQTHTAPSITFEKEIIDTFMVVESNSFLFLKYIDFRQSPPVLTQAQLNSVYNINWPPSPYYGYSDQFDLIDWYSGYGETYNYTPQGLNTSYSTPSTDFNNQFVLPAADVNNTGLFNTTFIPPFSLVPGETGGPINTDILKSIPLYNIQYIEINRRLSTTGLL
jgi:hypothetical protein